jgi:hypothetical protein
MNNSLRYASAGQIELRVDYMDVYSATFFAPCQIVVESSVKQFFFSIPRFFIGLLWIREVIGKRLGLKTAKGKTATLGEIERFKGQIGDSIALFHVWDRQANAIVTGQRDKHLDFVLGLHTYQPGKAAYVGTYHGSSNQERAGANLSLGR